MKDALAQLDALEARLQRKPLDLGAVLDQVRWAAAKALSADRATFYLVDHVRRRLVSRSADLPGVNRITLGIGEGQAGTVAATGRLQRLDSGTPRTAAARRTDAETGYITRTMMAAPVIDGGRVIGVLQVLNKERGDFTAADEANLGQIAERLRDVLAATSLASQLDPGSRHPLDFAFNQIVGAAPAMRELYSLIGRAARTDITVLLRGESGTGKSLVAKALHDNSSRRDAPFVAVDCAAIPENLLENELFGHEAGAYTGADRAQGGKVAAAEGGTLFLDEVGELTLQGQKKLLRLLQERSYYPVGATQPREADVRFVCATNRELEEAVIDGSFRRDLLFRLRVVELEVPPLRTRGAEDLDRLVDHFLYEHARAHELPVRSLTGAARAKIHAHDWPGNVRELRHVLEAAVVLATQDALDVADVRLPRPVGTADVGGFRVPEVRPLKEVTLAYAHWAVEQCEGNRSAAARALEISRTTLHGYLGQDP
ncbi:MAG: sigma 54-interacting transcriptional regulator [Alphaproteobacteria bacterium]|nr:sigma 54-interacting transcriptional regulator [Alphaproteobacteria bacterium]